MDLSFSNEFELSNKGFSSVHSEFVMNGWNLKKNQKDLLIYGKDEYPCDEFIIKVTPTNILVTVPITNTNYMYTTTFNNYFNACDYILLHLKTIEDYYNNKKSKHRREDDDDDADDEDEDAAEDD